MKLVSVIWACLLFTIVIAQAKSLDQKKIELKKIYEAGGISKIEYEKAKEFLTKSDRSEKEKKQSYTLGSKSKKTQINLFKKKDKEEITLEKIEELGQIIKFDKSYYPEEMFKKFRGCGKGLKCVGKKAGTYMMSNFGKSSSWGQKYPGKMIKSMAMYEVFYASRLYDARKSIQRFKDNKYKKDLFFLKRKKKDEEAIRSLFGLNKGRKNMREALGMNMDTSTKEAIQKFWLLGEFLDLGVPTNNNITINKDIKDRQDKLDIYKSYISILKKKLEERAEATEYIKDKS